MPSPDDLRFRDVALAQGFTDDELGRLVDAGRWVRLRRGAYLAGAAPEDPLLRHLLLVHATVRGLRPRVVVSHQSAAVLHGMTLWRVRLDAVHVTRPPGASSNTRGHLRCHVARMRDEEIVRVGPLLVTSPARTLLDLGRSLPFEPAVVTTDAALHRRLLGPEQLRAGLAEIVGIRGSRAAARVVAFADASSESVGESRSRVALCEMGLRPSAIQLPIRTASGIHRADFAWQEQRVIGEFDGRIKYGRLLRPGQEAGDAVFEEKLREDAIREENWGVVRWTWPDLDARPRLQQRVRRALERGPGRRR